MDFGGREPKSEECVFHDAVALLVQSLNAPVAASLPNAYYVKS